MLESIFLVLNRPIFGARSSFFGAGNLVLESTVLVLNRMLSENVSSPCRTIFSNSAKT